MLREFKFIMNRKNIGSRFEDFLKEEKLFEQVQATAVKRTIASQIATEMKRKGLSRTAMAGRMRTSPAALNRLLDVDNATITLYTLVRAASALGKKLRVEFD